MKGKKPMAVLKTEDEQAVIPDLEIDTLARCLLPKIQAYFTSTEGQAAFEEWKRKNERKEKNYDSKY